MQDDKLADDRLITGNDSTAAASQEPVVLETTEPATITAPTVSRRWPWILGVMVLAFLAVIGALLIHSHKAGQQNAAVNNTAAKVQNVNPGDVTKPAIPFQVNSNNKVVINGDLQSSQSLILTPTNQPAAAVLGQLYVDAATHQLRFYNGQSFVGVGIDNTLCHSDGTGCSGLGLSQQAVLSLLGSTKTVLPQDLSTNATPQFAGIRYRGSNGNVATVQAAGSTGNITFTLPATTGSNGQCLLTDGSGTLSFAACATGSGNAFLQGGNAFGATAVLGTTDNNGLNFVTNGSTQVSITAGGNVGIGNSNPQNKFAVNSPWTNDTGAVALISTGAATNKGLVVQGAVNQSANLFELQGSNASSLFSVGANGQLVSRNSSNSTAAFQVQNALGTAVVDADTVNQRLGVGLNAPQYTLDVNGDVNIAGSSALRIGGAIICTAAGCSASGTSGFYIQNSNGIQSNANFAIQSANPAYVGGVIRGATGQTANLFDLQVANGTNVLSVSAAGNVLIQPTIDSTSAFQIQNAAGNSNAFIVDTTNTRVGIGVTPSYTLDVNGDVNIAAPDALRIGGTVICTASGCNSGSGSGFYIQNGTGIQTSANFAIQSANLGYVGAVIRGAAGQTADILDLQNSTANNLFSVSAQGYVTVQNSADSIGSFVVKDQAGTSNVLVVDTLNKRVGINEFPTGYSLDVNGDVNLDNSGSLRINGTVVCSLSGCAASSGSGNYIQNGNGIQTNANFAIQSANPAYVGGLIRGAAGQTADVFEVQNSSTANLFKVDSLGVATFQNAADSSSGFAVNNSSGSTILSVNTSTGTVNATNPNGNALVGTTSNSSSYGVTGTQSAGVGGGVKGVGGGGFGVYGVSAANASGYFQTSDTSGINTHPTLVIQGNTNQATNLLEAQNTAGIAVFSISPTGAVLAKNSADSATAFQIEKSDGTSVLDVNTTTGRVGIGSGVTNPNAKLQITMTTPTTIGQIIQGASGQSADLLQFQDSNGVVTSKVDPNGVLTAYGTGQNFLGLQVPSNIQVSLTAGGSLTVGQQYWWEVTAYNSAGETVGSAQVTTTPTSGNQTALLTWSRVSGATGYKVYRDTASTFNDPNMLVATITNGSTANYTDTGTAASAGFPPFNVVNGTKTIIQGWQGQAGDLLDLQDSTNSNIFSVGGSGNLTVKPNQNQSGALVVQNASGAQILNVDTAGNTVNLGAGVPNALQAFTSLNQINDNTMGFGNPIIIVNGYIYTTGANSNTVYYAKVNGDGTIQAWQTGPALPTSLFAPGLATDTLNGTNYLYVVGGFTSSASGSGGTNKIYYMALNGSTGAPGAVQTSTNNLPTAIGYTQVFVFNHFLFSVGGAQVIIDGFLIEKPVFNIATVTASPLNAVTGAPGAFTATTSLPDNRGGAGTTIAQAGNGNTYAYVVGGFDASGNAKNTVYFAQVSNSGTVGAWSSTASLPGVTNGPGSTVFNSPTKTLFNGSISAINIGTVNNDGTISLWSRSPTSLPPFNWTVDFTINNGYLYTSLGRYFYYSQIPPTVNFNISGSFNAYGSGLIQTASGNSTTALQVQNSSGVNALSVDTTNLRENIAQISGTMGSITLTNQVVTGSTLPQTTYFYKVAATGANGNTFSVSPEASVTVSGAGNSVKIQWGEVIGAAGYIIYRGTSAGNENVFYQIPASAIVVGSNNSTVTFNDIGGTTSSGSPPASTTTDYYATMGAGVTGFNSSGFIGGVFTGSGNLFDTGNTGIQATGTKYGVQATQAAAGTSGAAILAQATDPNNLGVGTGMGIIAQSAGNTSALFQTLNTSGTNSSATVVIKDNTSQTADLLQAQTSGGVNMFSVGATGSVLSKNSSNSTTAFRIQNALATDTIFDVDTSNGRIGIGTAAPVARLGVQNLNGNAQTALLVNQANTANNILQFQSNGTNIATINGTGAVAFQNQTNSTAAFQIQNAVGEQAFNLDTTATGGNLMTNGSFELTPITQGATALGGATISQSSAQQYIGSNSLQVVGTTANDGVKFPVTLASGTAYTFAFQAKASSTFSTEMVGYSDDGATFKNCTNLGATPQTISSTGWLKFFCTFTTGTVSGSPFVFLRQSDTASHTYFVDAAVVNATATATSTYADGNFQLNGVVISPTTFRNQSDSSTAFRIQNTAGTSLLTGNTFANQLVIGTNTNITTADNGGGNTDSLTIRTGNAGGNSGSISIDSGSAGGTGGTISIGTGFAGAVAIGRTGIQTTVSSSLLVKNDGTTAMQIQNGAGSTTFLKVDTTASGGVTANGTTGLTATGSTGAGVFGQSSGGVSGLFQTSVADGSNTSATLVARANTSQTADLLQAQDASNTVLYRISATGVIGSADISAASTNSATTTLRTGNSSTSGNTGQLNLNTGNATSGNSGNVVIGAGSASGTAGGVLVKNGTDSTTAFVIQSAGGTPLLTADTSGMKLTVTSLIVNLTLTVNGHIISGNSSGSTTVLAGAAACTSPTVSVSGNDTAGTVTITTGTGCAGGGTLATVNFANSFGSAPRVVLTPAGTNGATLQYFNGTTGTGSFTVDSNTAPTDATTYTFNYFVIQ